MSSRRPDAGTNAASDSEALTAADVDSIASHLLDLALPNSAEQHVEATLRRLAPVCVVPEVPLRHVDRVQFFKARAPPPPPPPQPSEPAPAPTALRGDTGPSVAEYMAAKISKSAHDSGASSVSSRARWSNALRPAPGVTVAAPEPADTAGAEVATGGDVGNTEQSPSPSPSPSPLPEPPAERAPRRQRLPAGAFCRHAASTTNEAVNDQTPDRFLTPVSILRSSTSLQYAAPGWATAPDFVEGFDDECVLGDTPEERVGSVRPPTKDEFLAMWHDFTKIDYPAYVSAHQRWLESFKDAFPGLFKLIGEANAAIEEAKQRVDLGSVQEWPEVQVVDAGVAPSSVVDAQEAVSLDEALARVQQTKLRLENLRKGTLEENNRLKALEVTASATKEELCNHVLKHYEAIAEIGRAEPAVDIPPLRADCMAPIRTPPTMSHRVRYIGLRNHLHQFLSRLRDDTERYWVDPKHEEEAKASPLVRWMPSNWHAKLVDQRAVCFAAVKEDRLREPASEGTSRYAKAEREVAKMRSLMQASMEQDADAFERTTRLVDYVLRAFFEYAPSKSRDAGGRPRDELQCTWEDVERYACEHVLPFVTRLLLGDGALAGMHEDGYDVATAPGVVPFSEWVRSRGGSEQVEAPRFRTTLEALKKEVDENTNRTTGGGPAWGDEREQARFAAVLKVRLKSLESQPYQR